MKAEHPLPPRLCIYLQPKVKIIKMQEIHLNLIKVKNSSLVSYFRREHFTYVGPNSLELPVWYELRGETNKETTFLPPQLWFSDPQDAERPEIYIDKRFICCIHDLANSEWVWHYLNS